MKVIKTGLMLLGIVSVAGLTVSLLNMTKINNLDKQEKKVEVKTGEIVKVTNLNDLNIHFSESSPKDTSMLWVKTANAPTKLSYNNKADVQLLEEIEGFEYEINSLYETNAFVDGVYYDFYNQKKVNLKTGEIVEDTSLTNPGNYNRFTTWYNGDLYYGLYNKLYEFDTSTSTIRSFSYINDSGSYAYEPLILHDNDYLYTFGKSGARKYLLTDIRVDEPNPEPINFTNFVNSNFYGRSDKKAWVIDNFIINFSQCGTSMQKLYVVNKNTMEVVRENDINKTYGLYIKDVFSIYNEIYAVLPNGDLMKYDVVNDKFINLNKNIGSFENGYIWNDLATNEVYIYRDGKFSTLDNKVLLNQNECLLYYSYENDKRFNLYKNDNINAQVCLPEAVYIGNENNEAVKCECYAYNNDSKQWELI